MARGGMLGNIALDRRQADGEPPGHRCLGLAGVDRLNDAEAKILRIRFHTPRIHPVQTFRSVL
jgi:hypothetical protein